MTGYDSDVLGRTRAYSGVLGRTRAYSGVLGRTWAYSGVLGRTRAYSGVLGRTRAYSGVLGRARACSGVLERTRAYSACSRGTRPQWFLYFLSADNNRGRVLVKASFLACEPCTHKPRTECHLNTHKLTNMGVYENTRTPGIDQIVGTPYYNTDPKR